ncbi:hypothetical protein R5R35_007824 [Gryllus longicercus]|uniref:SAM domain-containing protein n=1 Tax=Gryllus longicercus TaxID=2509291 RepID=A0AAN9W9P9_9ORTH
MALMRRLLGDAQAKFRKMVEENRALAAELAAAAAAAAAAAREDGAGAESAASDAKEGGAAVAPGGEPSASASEQPAAAAAAATTATADAPEGGGGGGGGGAEADPAAEPSIRPPSPPIAGARGPSADEPGPSTSSDLAGAAAAAAGAGPSGPSGPTPLPVMGAGARSKLKSGVGSLDGNPAAAMRLRLDNERLQCEVAELRKLVAGGGVSSAVTAAAAAAAGASGGDESSRVAALELELRQAREALAALKADRKRLKAEKFDLLNQMKQLYGTLEDKEKELRDFIRNYEQRMRESEASLQQLTSEREERERERWSLLRHARDEAERSLALAAQLEQRDAQLRALQDQLAEARRQLGGGGSDQESLASMSLSVSRVNGSSTGGLPTPTAGSGAGAGALALGLATGGGSGGASSSAASGVGGLLGLLPGDRGSCSADSGVRGSSDRESGGATSAGGNLSDSTTDGGTPTITVEDSNIDMDSISVVSSIAASQMYPSATTPKDCSPSLSPLAANAFSKSIDSSVLSRSVEQLSSPALELEPRRSGKASAASGGASSGRGSSASGGGGGGGGSRGGTWGSISRVFARSRHRKAASPSQDEAGDAAYRSWSPLTEEGYAEKLRLLREAASVPMERWRAPTVLAWLEIALGMPQYGPRCAENIKSGKVLLELSDVELEHGLGISHPMHRKKLRLAIEEHRHPALVRYPCIAQLGHTWVSSEWLPDLGLAQYSENFATNMVDARMLDHLSKKELEKFLGVTRKFHQASVVHGIHLLRMMKYDRQALAVRRHQCETVDADPLVWTNQRFIRWARNIDLSEYADNLKDSGVHGALVVLEPSFNGDTMATALGIPPSKNIIRRHLCAELEALVLPARAAFEHFVRVSKSERRKRAEKLVGGGSLGRSFSRSYAGSLADRPGGWAEPAPGRALPQPEPEKERRRASLRTYSLLYLKKFSSWRSSQGSLSRALGLKLRGDSQHNRKRDSRELPGTSNGVASPSSSSENSSSIANFNYHRPGSYQSQGGSEYSAPAGLSETFKQRHHRRVKSIGDIDTVTVTPV